MIPKENDSGTLRDPLNRLTQYRVTQTHPNASFSVDYAYDAVGNLRKKTDYSANQANAYRYAGDSQCANSTLSSNGTFPANGVCQVITLDNRTVNFAYDQRGNLTQDDGLTLTYNHFDKPIRVLGTGAGNRHASNATDTRFTYGPDEMRHKQVRIHNGETTTTHYIDGLYEIDLEANRQRSFIGDSTLLNWHPDDGYQLLFTLKDRLGSATTLANHDGQVISRRYFDPFGKTSSAFDNTTTDIKVGLNTEANANSTHANNAFTDLNKNNHYRRGFTGHEHLNEQQLIHMNGRMYDYNLGRFLSVDPFIQSPGNTQSVNPYAYIMNNPLAGTDPTGYCSAETGSVIKKCVDVEVTDTRTSQIFTKSMNKLHSGFTNNAANYAASKLGNGAKVTEVSATLKNGDVQDAMSQSTISSSGGKPDKTEATTDINGQGSNDTNQGSGFGIDDAASIGVGFTPAGIAADAYTAATGEDLFTGEEVSGMWRWVGLIPFVSEARKGINGADAAIDSVASIRKGGDSAREFWTGSTTFQGNKVYQRNDLIDPKLVDAKGRSNLQRMQKGLAPIGPDGKPMNLHHMTQRHQGAIAEMTQSFHKSNHKTIHINPPSIPSGINRSKFNKWRSDYWKNRANDF